MAGSKIKESDLHLRDRRNLSWPYGSLLEGSLCMYLIYNVYLAIDEFDCRYREYTPCQEHPAAVVFPTYRHFLFLRCGPSPLQILLAFL